VKFRLHNEAPGLSVIEVGEFSVMNVLQVVAVSTPEISRKRQAREGAEVSSKCICRMFYLLMLIWWV